MPDHGKGVGVHDDAQHSTHEHSGHEHPAAYTPRPLIAERDRVKIRDRAKDLALSPCVEPLFDALDALEECANCARRYCFGEFEAGVHFEAALGVIRSSQTEHSHGEEHPTKPHANDLHAAQPRGKESLELSLAWAADVLSGLTLWSAGNKKQFAVDAKAIRDLASAAASWVELLHVAFDESDGGRSGVAAVARALQCGCSQQGTAIKLEAPHGALASRARSARAFVATLDAMIASWTKENPFDLAFEATQGKLPGVRVTERDVVAGTDLQLAPIDGEFPAKQAENVGVFFGSKRVQAKVARWSRREIVVSVPEGEGPSFVRLERTLERAPEALVASAKAWQATLGDEWTHSVLSLFAFYGWPGHRSSSAVVHVVPAQAIDGVVITDVDGRVIENGSHIRAGARLHVWTRGGGADAPPVELVVGGVALRAGRRERDAPATFELDDAIVSAGIEAAQVRFGNAAIPAWPRPISFIQLSIAPDPVRLLVPSSWSSPDPSHRAPPVAVTITSPRVFPRDVAIRVTSSDPTKFVVLDESLTLTAGSRTVTALVSASMYGAPREAAAILEASLSFERTIGTGAVEVWIEPAQGRWVSRGRLNIVAVHAALFPSGKVLFFSPSRQFDAAGNIERDSAGNAKWNLGHNAVEIETWDSRTGALSPSPMAPSAPTRNLFCAGHCHLPDGKLLLAGGHNNFPETHPADRHVHVYDPDAASGAAWSRFSPEMNRGRWYPTCTVMPDGRVLIVSGTNLPYGPVLGGAWNAMEFFGYGANTKYEIFDGARGGLVALDHNRFIDDRWMGTYPYVFVLPKTADDPQGVVVAFERDRAHLFRYTAEGPDVLKHVATHFANSRSIRTFPTYGSAVLLPFRADATAVSVLIAGGGNETRTGVSNRSAATDTAELFTFDTRISASSQPRPYAPTPLRMNARRFLSDATILPDGNVLFTGGAAVGYTNENSGPVFDAELFMPITNSFRVMAAATIERRYHSVALLLPDATVLCAGSTGAFVPGTVVPQFEMEAFQPPYLWRGPAPAALNTLPSSVSYGSTVRVDVDPSRPAPRKAVIIKLTSVTHANNMDQRSVELVVGRVEATLVAGELRQSIIYDVPGNGSIAPPGHYMLFLVDAFGVPNDGHMIRIG